MDEKRKGDIGRKGGEVFDLVVWNITNLLTYHGEVSLSKVYFGLPYFFYNNNRENIVNNQNEFGLYKKSLAIMLSDSPNSKLTFSF